MSEPVRAWQVPDPSRWRLVEVGRIEPLTPHMVRVVFTGDLGDFDPGAATDSYVKILFPPPGADYAAPFDPEEIKALRPREEWPRRRTYTVRRWDGVAGELTLDFVVHGDTGVAGPWVVGAEPGDRVQIAGPGGEYAPERSFDRQLLVGDAAVIPAIAVTLERLPEGMPADVVVAVDGPQEEQPLPERGDVTVRWVHGGSRELSDAVAALEIPAGRIQAFVHGEASAVREIRRQLLTDRRVEKDGLSASGYWKERLSDEGWRAEKPEWKRQVAEDDRAASV